MRVGAWRMSRWSGLKIVMACRFRAIRRARKRWRPDALRGWRVAGYTDSVANTLFPAVRNMKTLCRNRPAGNTEMRSTFFRTPFDGSLHLPVTLSRGAPTGQRQRPFFSLPALGRHAVRRDRRRLTRGLRTAAHCHTGIAFTAKSYRIRDSAPSGRAAASETSRRGMASHRVNIVTQSRQGICPIWPVRSEFSENTNA